MGGDTRKHLKQIHIPMTRYDVIKKRIEAQKGNKIGDSFLSIKSIAKETGYSIDIVRPIVQQLVYDGVLKFRNPSVREQHKTYDNEHLLKSNVNKPKFQKRDNSWLYQ